MSRAKLFNMLQARGSSEAGRNPFDLSSRHVFTSKAARITPVKAIHTIPKDFFRIRYNEFSQNNIPMNTAAFLDGIKELSAYYVPYNTIWHNFNQYMATREDPDSVILQEKGISYEPRIALNSLYGMAFTLFVLKLHHDYVMQLYALRDFYSDVLLVQREGSEDENDTFLNYARQQLGEDATWESVIQFATDYYYKYIDVQAQAEFVIDSTYDSILANTRRNMFLDAKFRPLVEMTLYSNFSNLHCTTYETENNSEETKPTYADVAMDMFGEFRWCQWLQKLDMLGYGNIYPLFNKCLNTVSKAFSDTIMSASAFDDRWHDTQFYARYNSALTKVNAEIERSTTYFDGVNKRFNYYNAYALYAYNKVFYDMFRNVYYDLNYSVRNYNVDFLDCNSLEGSIIYSKDIPYRFYSLECHQWRKDMFTGVLPDNQLGEVSELILSSVGQSTLDLPVSGTITASGGQVGSPVYTDEMSSFRTPLDATEKPVKVVTGSGTYKVFGTFDSSVSNDTSVRIQTDHSHSLDGLSLQHNLRATGSGSIGDVSLNVLALKRSEALQQYRQDLMRAGNRTRDIFHQIFGASPKSELDESPYFIEAVNNSININPIISTADTGQQNNGRLGDIAARVTMSGNALSFEFSTEDFGCILLMSYAVPESMYNSYRIDPNVACLSQEEHGLPYFQNLGLQPVIGEFLNNLRSSNLRNMTLGFTPPYIEKKTDIDLAHGNLVDLSMSDDEAYQGSLSHWVVARTDMQQQNSVTLRNFYIDPAVLDNVFQFDAGDDYETDHFINYANVSVYSVRALSEIGLPRFV